MQKTQRQLLITICLVAGYAGIIFYFSYVDVYHSHFFDASYSPLYNIARTVFGFYLFFVLYTTGNCLIDFLERRMKDSFHLSFGERIIACFFAGAISWQFFTLGLGYLSLYTRAIVFALTVPFVLLSSLAIEPFFNCARKSLAARLHGYNSSSRILTLTLMTALMITACLVFAVKGLYPAGGHDYFTHYFYYYVEVLKNHGVWPNDVWYHYFYSKGEGIFFLSMILTDPLAPSIVTYCFVAVGTLALFIFIDRLMPGTLWPWAATTCFLAVLIYDGGETGLSLDNTNYWAEFPKEHEINAAFVVVFVWLCDSMMRASGSKRGLFFALACACAVSVAYLEQPSPVFLSLFAIIVAVILFPLGHRRQAVEFSVLACASGAGFISNLILNYLTTGIPNDTLINAFWRYLNLHTIESLGWFDTIIWRSENLAYITNNYSLSMSSLPRNLAGFFHLALVQPWFVYTPGAICSVVTAIFLSTGMFLSKGGAAVPHTMRLSVLLVTSVFLAFLILAVTLGASLPDSFYRYSSFIVPFEFAAGAMIWILIISMSGFDWVRKVGGVGLPVLLVGLVVTQLHRIEGNKIAAVARDAIRFISGRYSIYDAYVEQAVWPTRMPFGAIYPGSVSVWERVGRGTRVWSFHVHSYCMLPDCRLESNGSFLMSPHLFDIMFGPPDKARDILQREGLNYFFISRELAIRDIRPAVGLFSPEHIGDYLGIKWTDGTTYLLTWIGPDVAPLSAEWLAEYRRQCSESPEVARAHKNEILFRDIYEMLKSAPTPASGSELKLPWLGR
jgi:hypothetical protein